MSIGMKHLTLHPYHLKKILTFSRVVRSIMSELQTTDSIKLYETEQVCHSRGHVDIPHSTSPVLQSVCSKYFDRDLYNWKREKTKQIYNTEIIFNNLNLIIFGFTKWTCNFRNYSMLQVHWTYCKVPVYKIKRILNL